MMRERRIQALHLGLGLVTAGCEIATGTISAPGPNRAPRDAMPASVDVPAAVVSVGTVWTGAKEKKSVAAFRISTNPISVAEYRRCVDAGACEVPNWDIGTCRESHKGPDGNTYAQAPSDPTKVAVTCAAPEQAAAFCSWVGGAVPTPGQWLLAARGPTIAGYTWGNGTVDCQHHWRTVFDSLVPTACCGKDCNNVDSAAFRDPAASSAVAGRMQNVLWTSAELLAADPTSEVQVCAHASRGCLVRGLTPGGIDSFTSLPDVKNHSPMAIATNLNLPSTGFRCVWES